jgi:hypothetical protein
MSMSAILCQRSSAVDVACVGRILCFCPSCPLPPFHRMEVIMPALDCLSILKLARCSRFSLAYDHSTPLGTNLHCAFTRLTDLQWWSTHRCVSFHHQPDLHGPRTSGVSGCKSIGWWWHWTVQEWTVQSRLRNCFSLARWLFISAQTAAPVWWTTST